MKENKIPAEKELFDPIKEYFEKEGYVVDGEVNGIDMYLERGDEHVAVELKKTLDFRSVQQAALRQKITDTVYIGIYRPSDFFSRSFKDKLYILKRLGIGLIVVSPKTGQVSVASLPVVSELSAFQSRNKGKKEALTREFSKRKVKANTGGVRGTKLVTGYREDALMVLDALMECGGEGSSASIKEKSKVENATQILYRNYYGWFEQVKRGYYKVTDAGYDALVEFETIIASLHSTKQGD